MLYILPPLRAQNPPAPWSNLICGNGTTSSNIERDSWSDSKRPPRIKLRNLQIIKSEDESTGFQDDVDANRNPKSLSECYFAGKGTALVLPDADAQSKAAPGCGGRRTGCLQGSTNIQKHLQSMFYLLRPEETLKMAVKLESVHPTRTRYLVVVSRMGSRREEECCLLGIDCNEKTTVGLVLKVLANAQITLDGDGGFSVSVCDRHHIFKPVSVQAMWSALQTLHKVSAKAREQNYFQGGMTHGWVDYYENRIESDRSCLNEWHAMDNLESRRPPSPDSVRTKPTEREETERVIRATLKEIMMSVDLDEVTSKVIRTRLEEELDMDLGEYKSFIDQEMLVILGQMDAPTEIFEHVYLGSEWNASNYEELQRNGVGHILNVTREIDNFFPGTFDYLNVRVYDDEKTDLLKHWDDTFKYITKAKDKGSKVLVHCKMGVSRSASVVIAYAMKAYDWDFDTALQHVKEKRTCIKPNSSFLCQLETYQGILDAMKNKEKLQRSKSETNLKSPAVNASNDKASAYNEPTPVNQTLSQMNAVMTGQELRSMGARPKSWSPDNLATRELAAGVKSSPVFMSLEDVSQKSLSKESVRSLQLSDVSSLARHVLMPCDNGESYSVSPNQIVHLPGHDTISIGKKTVLNLATRFESCETVNKVLADAADSKKDTWDPGEKGGGVGNGRTNDCDLKTGSVINSSDGRTSSMWTSSTKVTNETNVLATCGDNLVKVKVADCTEGKKEASDPFSNQLDRVFDREEKKQRRKSTALNSTVAVPNAKVDNNITEEQRLSRECPSRQSSWSSYDSAVVLGFQTELSRHSSWGSGDTSSRTLPISRNSSWGSYDMRPRALVQYVNERGEKVAHSNVDLLETDTEACQSASGIFPYDKEDIPWHPGTVKRTKQKIEKNKQASDSSNASITKTPSSETLFDFGSASDRLRPAETVNVALVENERKAVFASKKIDIPIEERKADNSRLSVSAPEPCSMELVTVGEVLLSRSASNVSTSDKRHANRHSEDLSENTGCFGKVRNLKKEFEAKSILKTESQATIEQTPSIADISKAKSNRNSLPSSPVSVHEKRDKKPSLANEDPSSKTKSLIGIFENNKEDGSDRVNLRLKYRQNGGKTQAQRATARHSCIEVSVEKSPAKLIKNGSAVDKGEGEYKRPPIAPVVRTASPNVVAATVIATAARKQQQYGKSHPLARLNVRPRHNNPVYNTM